MDIRTDIMPNAINIAAKMFYLPSTLWCSLYFFFKKTT